MQKDLTFYIMQIKDSEYIGEGDAEVAPMADPENYHVQH